MPKSPLAETPLCQRVGSAREGSLAKKQLKTPNYILFAFVLSCLGAK